MKKFTFTTFLKLAFLSGLVTIIFFSCTPEWHLKHAIKKRPSLMVKDTIVISDTVFTTGYSKDTIVSLQRFIHSRDTLIIHNNKLTIRQYVLRDSIFITGECQGDTIIKTIRVPYEKVVYKEKSDFAKAFWWGIVVLIVLAGIFILSKLFKKIGF